MANFNSSENILDYFIFREKLNSFGIKDKVILKAMGDLGIEIKDLVGGYRKSIVRGNNNNFYLPSVFSIYLSNTKQEKVVKGGVLINEEVTEILYNIPDKTPQSVVLLKYMLINEFRWLKLFKPTIYDLDLMFIQLDNYTAYIDIESLYKKDYVGVYQKVLNGFKNIFECAKDKSITVEQMIETYSKSDLCKYLSNL